MSLDEVKPSSDYGTNEEAPRDLCVKRMSNWQRRSANTELVSRVTIGISSICLAIISQLELVAAATCPESAVTLLWFSLSEDVQTIFSSDPRLSRAACVTVLKAMLARRRFHSAESNNWLSKQRNPFVRLYIFRLHVSSLRARIPMPRNWPLPGFSSVYPRLQTFSLTLFLSWALFFFTSTGGETKGISGPLFSPL